MLDEVARFRAGHERGRGLPIESIPLVIAGDFNATPYESITGGRDGNGGYEPLCYRQLKSHPLALQSAFPIENMFTTWKIRPATTASSSGGEGVKGGSGSTRETKHCIDYVWTSRGVRPMQRSTLPTAEGLGPLRAPSFVYPSDHFALAVDLLLPCL